MKKVLFLLVAILALTGCGGANNRVLIENRSDFIFTSITVAVCDSVWTIHNMAPGKQQEFTVVYNRDDHFRVKAIREDGLALEEGFGYVTHGIAGDLNRITMAGDSISYNLSMNNY